MFVQVTGLEAVPNFSIESVSIACYSMVFFIKKKKSFKRRVEDSPSRPVWHPLRTAQE